VAVLWTGHGECFEQERAWNWEEFLAILRLGAYPLMSYSTFREPGRFLLGGLLCNWRLFSFAFYFSAIQPSLQPCRTAKALLQNHHFPGPYGLLVCWAFCSLLHPILVEKTWVWIYLLTRLLSSSFTTTHLRFIKIIYRYQVLWSWTLSFTLLAV
jgi:hypothetical protein